MKKILLLSIFSLCILFSCKEDEVDSISICDSPPLWELVLGNSYFGLPNVFTPNNNGINDQFRLIKTSYGIDNPTQAITDYSLTIKQGSTIVFEQDNGSISWDGTYNSEIVSGLLDYTLSISDPSSSDVLVFEGEVVSLPNIADSDWNDDNEYLIENCETCITENKLGNTGWIGDDTGEPELCEE